MKIKKLLTTGILLTMTAAFMTGCGNDGAATTDTTETGSGEPAVEEVADDNSGADEENSKVVRFLTPGTSSDGGAMMSENAQIAQINGYFEEELGALGYSVEYYGFQSQGVGVNEALAAGEGDVAVYGEYPALTYLSGGNDGVIIGKGSSRKQMAILAKDDIGSVADLKGKVVGATLGTNSQQYLEDELKKNGLTTDDVEIVNSAAELPSLFVSGDVDAIVSDAQMIYYVQGLAGSGSIIAVNGNDPELASNFLVVARNEFLDANPDVKQAVLNALRKAQEFAAADPEQVYQLLADASGSLPVEIYQQYYAFDKSFDFWNPELTDEDIAAIQKTADYMAEIGIITSNININDYISK